MARVRIAPATPGIKDKPILAMAVSFPPLFQQEGCHMAASGKISHGCKDGVNWSRTWRIA